MLQYCTACAPLEPKLQFVSNEIVVKVVFCPISIIHPRFPCDRLKVVVSTEHTVKMADVNRGAEHDVSWPKTCLREHICIVLKYTL